MANTLKVIGGIIMAVGAFLTFTLPSTTEHVGENLRHSIPYRVASPEVIQQESPRFQKLQEEYDDAMRRLISARFTETLIISAQLVIIGALLFQVGRERAKKFRNEGRP